ncbi:MAG: RHS repeat-associated core domain-containing protein, partial [Flavobacterium sp.]
VRHTPRPTGTSYGAFDYVYNYTDHLGNIRLSYTLDPSDQVLKILEENHYYPFGMKHTYNVFKKDIITVDGEIDINGNLVNPTNNLTNFEPAEDIRRVRMVSNTGYQYKYNGKEYQDELGLNVTFMDFRQYDAAIGRFNGMDRLTELVPSTSPYRFGFNNPVYWSDPTGLLEQSENLSSLNTDFPSADVSITFERLGGNGHAICQNCPKTERFKKYIDDPYNSYTYHKDTDSVTKDIALEGVTVSATQTSQSNSNNNNWWILDLPQRNKNFDRLFNSALGFYGTIATTTEAWLRTEEKALKKRGTKTATNKIEKLIKPSLKKVRNFGTKIGYLGAAVSAGSLGYDIISGQEITAGQVFDTAVSVGLSLIAISNPVGLLALGTYTVIDMYGGFDGLKEYFGGNTIILNEK